MDRLLLTVPEAAEQLSLSLATAKRLIQTGELLSVKVRGARRVPAEAIREYLDELIGDAKAERQEREGREWMLRRMKRRRVS